MPRRQTPPQTRRFDFESPPLRQKDHYLAVLENMPRYRTWVSIMRDYEIVPEDSPFADRIGLFTLHLLERSLPLRLVHGPQEGCSVLYRQVQRAALKVPQSTLPLGYSQSRTFYETTISGGLLHLGPPVCYISLHSRAIQMGYSLLHCGSRGLRTHGRTTSAKDPKSIHEHCREDVYLSVLGRVRDQDGIDRLVNGIVGQIPFLHRVPTKSGRGECTISPYAPVVSLDRKESATHH